MYATDWNDPLRRSAIVAYTRTEGTIFVVGTVISALSIIFCLLMPSKFLVRSRGVVYTDKILPQIITWVSNRTL